MIIAEVLGSVTADQHHPGYDGLPIKMVRPVHGDEDLLLSTGSAPHPVSTFSSCVRGMEFGKYWRAAPGTLIDYRDRRRGD